MVNRPRRDNSFEFVRLASLRAAQLMRGCTPHVVASTKAIVTAQQEVASGFIRALPREAKHEAKRGNHGHDGR
jgi:DNA-directed RNA polymerase subunit K/omega